MRFCARRAVHQRAGGSWAITEASHWRADSDRYGQPVEHRDERIIVETDRHRITGVLRLPADGYRSRLTDYLNASERVFLALTNVEVTTINGSAEPEQREFLALSLRHIVLAMPVSDEDAEIA